MLTKVLLCSNKEEMSHNSKYMFEMLISSPDYEVKYVINNLAERERLNSIYGDYFISTKSKSGKTYLKKADVWLLDGGMPTKNIFFMMDKIIINYWHGVPLKRVGVKGYLGLNKLRVAIQLKLFSYFLDSYVTTSENLVDIMSESFLVPLDKVKVMGQPRNDGLFLPAKLKSFHDHFPDVSKNDKFVLYAPTWRKSKYGTAFDDEVRYFPFDDYSREDLEAFLEGNGITMFLRPHPLEKINIEESRRVKIFDSSKTNNINDFLNIFDLLIADYSGIYVDYLLLKKPIIFLPYDLQEYGQVKGFNFDFHKVSPGPKPSSFCEFKEELLKLLCDQSYYESDRGEMLDFFHTYKEGFVSRNLKYLESLI